MATIILLLSVSMSSPPEFHKQNLPAALTSVNITEK